MSQVTMSSLPHVTHCVTATSSGPCHAAGCHSTPQPSSRTKIGLSVTEAGLHTHDWLQHTVTTVQSTHADSTLCCRVVMRLRILTKLPWTALVCTSSVCGGSSRTLDAPTERQARAGSPAPLGGSAATCRPCQTQDTYGTRSSHLQMTTAIAYPWP